MALQDAYKQFLATPNPTFLTSNASLHYITTLVSVNGQSEIIKHLNNQNHQLSKKEEKILDVVEGPKALSAEVHTTIEFKTSGGSYLPGLDDNFLADRVVTFPIIHIVNFENGKIRQVRQNWDQGSLLKLIDVIGKTGRNWPIRDGKDQIKLITSSVKSGGKVDTQDSQDEYSRSRSNTNNVTRDPHASLSLFAPREHSYQDPMPAVIPHRPSARPAPRDYNDLFVGSEEDKAPAVKSPSPERSASPSKNAKGGAGKNYRSSRLFDNDELNDHNTPEKVHSEDKFYQPNPARYQHFDFGEADAPIRPAKEVNTKHASQWDFGDFHTPHKVVPKEVRANDVRHWGNEQDESLDSPIKFKKVDKPRKDAETHFEFRDDGTPQGERRIIGRPRGAGQNNGLGLYRNNLYDEDNSGAPGAPTQKVINNPVSIKDRHKDFDPHFSMTDDPPHTQQVQGPLGDDHAKAVKMMEASWDNYEQSPNQKENVPASQSTTGYNGTGNGPLSERTFNRNENKGIAIGGDGMGGKKGTGRSWGFGDESEGEEDQKFKKAVPGKKQTQRSTGGDFWDF